VCEAADVAITTFNAAHSYGDSKAEYLLGRRWVREENPELR
jgi:aryl-alcohol dehydrogenase-like predicted oxidoreductase